MLPPIKNALKDFKDPNEETPRLSDFTIDLWYLKPGFRGHLCSLLATHLRGSHLAWRECIWMMQENQPGALGPPSVTAPSWCTAHTLFLRKMTILSEVTVYKLRSWHLQQQRQSNPSSLEILAQSQDFCVLCQTIYKLVLIWKHFSSQFLG